VPNAHHPNLIVEAMLSEMVGKSEELQEDF